MFCYAVSIRVSACISNQQFVQCRVLSCTLIFIVYSGAARICFKGGGKQQSIDTRGLAKILVRMGEHQTKFPLRSQEFRFEAVTFSKNLLNEDF